ncbi:glycosyltransferase [Litorivita pollutaquae]|uniref:Glycosyltransferase n=1 Tax=Litorivita pollutaquae TaxID=2200892 RepID=A0A2V4NMJ2_9RHOB|nr:glycosyltransferase [Litorivita pollutaquae]PYC47537.1 glycosyltransferase [Litorivita pollutaquae]
MKILYYNWVDYLDFEKRGGGVTVYQRNVIEALDKEPNVDAWFISSGISYDVVTQKPRWERLKYNASAHKGRRFEIVNSGVLAPAHHSFGSVEQLSHPATEETFFDFIDKNGPFDVVHFNNLEGLPVDVLRLKERWPETKVIVSLHNYYPICPQVNLWYDERENCTNFENGSKCASCLQHRPDTRIVKLANGVAYNFKRKGIKPGTKLFDKGFRPAMRLAGRSTNEMIKLKHKIKGNPAKPEDGNTQPAHHAFVDRRAHFVDTINRYADRVLCVSERVGVVAAYFGIKPALIDTSYIGTKQSQKYAETKPNKTILREDGTITLGYMGYMRRDKGFFFLLDALEALDAKTAKKIRLVICARRGDHATMERVAALKEKFLDLSYADGYTHEQLDKILKNVDVGVVPVLWEDNLPQVAIEMHARHIPLLTSDLGGAKELSSCADMVFRAGDTAGLHGKLRDLLAGTITQEAYWKDAMAPLSMKQHIDELMAFYA